MKLGTVLFNSIKEVIQEPKRERPKTLRGLDIKSDGGVSNIVAVYNDATIAEKEYWGKWYHHAKLDVIELSNKHDVQFNVVAAIVAILSPGNKWIMNLKAADKILIYYQLPKQQSSETPPTAPKINAYPANIKKSLMLLKAADTKLSLDPAEFVVGPKVKVFYKSLLNPTSIEDQLVLDGHAINIWRGTRKSLKGLDMPTIKQRARMLEDYRTAAQSLDVTVQAVQAVTWYVWKYVQPEKLKLPFVTTV